MKRSVGLLVPVFLAAIWAAPAAGATELDAWVPTADEVRDVAARQVTYASTRPCCPPTRRKRWEFEIAVPVWIPGVSGTFGEGSGSVDSDGGIGDVLGDLVDVETKLNFAFVGLFRARHGPWSFTVEGFGVRLGNSVTFKLTDGTLVDAELGAIIASARAGYRVWTRPFRLFSQPACFQVDATAGARLYHASFEITLPVGPKVEADKTWTDPIVGLDMELQLGRRLSLIARADVGGFGVGADLAWWVTTGVEYRFSRVFSLGAGWTHMDADYTGGSGDEEFRWNLTLSGPQLIAGFRF